MNLRLNTLAKMVDSGSRLADIGTDHAYLPITLIQNNQIDFAIASDIAKGPLQNAISDIKEAGLSSKIETRLGAGLSTITKEDHVDTVVIAGMGGKLMISILNDAWLKEYHFETLILEPNISEPAVRTWLEEHNYKIIAEEIVAEAGHNYELIKAQLSLKKIFLTEKERYFGPIILKNKTKVFYQKWHNQLKYYQKLRNNLNKARNKDISSIKKVSYLINMIEEELDD